MVEQSLVLISLLLLSKTLENLLKNGVVKWKWKHDFNWNWHMWSFFQWCSSRKFVKRYHNLETKINKVLGNENEWMKKNLQKLHTQKLKWRLHGKFAFFWVFLMC